MVKKIALHVTTQASLTLLWHTPFIVSDTSGRTKRDTFYSNVQVLSQWLWSAPLRVVSDCRVSENLFRCKCSVNYIQCHARRILSSVMLCRVVWYHITEEGNIKSLCLNTLTSLPMTLQVLTWSAKLISRSVSNSPFGGKDISFERSVLLDPWNIQNPCYNPRINFILW
jgi:hypothetical protein